MIRTIRKTKQIGYSQIVFECEKENGEYLDTKVIINDQLLCVIAGNTIAEFSIQLESLINHYRI